MADVMKQVLPVTLGIANKERMAAAKEAVLKIQKSFGKGAAQLGPVDATGVQAISSGSFKIDKALGVGGFPRGRVTEIYGPESSGKTTLTLHAIAECQKAGGVAAFIDAEHAFDPLYAANLGVNVDELLVSQPDNGEQALDVALSLAESGAVDLVVVDSVAALVPKNELEGEMSDQSMGVQARMMSKFCRSVTGLASRSKTAIVMINQIRMKIGVMFGNPETTTGGNALKFTASIRVEVRSPMGDKIKDEAGVFHGSTMNVKVVKNKVAPPFATTSVEIMFGTGFNKIRDILESADDLKLIDVSGAWYTFPQNGKKVQGEDAAANLLVEDGALVEQLRKEITAKIAERKKGVRASDALADAKKDKEREKKEAKKDKKEAK